MYRAFVGPFDPTMIMMFTLKDASDWWHVLNDTPVWQDRIFHGMAVLYGLVAIVAMMQLFRIQQRVPEYGWTTQKVFHFLNFVVNAVRCLIFVFRRDIQDLKQEVRMFVNPPFGSLRRLYQSLILYCSFDQILKHILLDVPSLAFFTTYALLVLFWAEIYYQIALWLAIWWKPVRIMVILSKMFFAGVCLFAALGFLLYGGRLFLMLQRFPVESKGRRKKLQEANICFTVGYVTSICFTCFLIRSVMMCFNAFHRVADLDVMEHPVMNLMYYLLVEILPSALVLFILKKLPPKRGINQYHNIR
ncbi:hypothetical protein HanOQP8_Chr06g0216271 [Helianthus annuus]|nr:hypothetical protein HanOQP8_Chr06g0216271 [Helianthus annuus]